LVEVSPKKKVLHGTEKQNGKEELKNKMEIDKTN
jgi:hypothetical protein